MICPSNLVKDFYCFNVVSVRSLENESVWKQILPFEPNTFRCHGCITSILVDSPRTYYMPPLCCLWFRRVQQRCYYTGRIHLKYFSIHIVYNDLNSTKCNIPIKHRFHYPGERRMNHSSSIYFHSYLIFGDIGSCVHIGRSTISHNWLDIWSTLSPHYSWLFSRTLRKLIFGHFIPSTYYTILLR